MIETRLDYGRDYDYDDFTLLLFDGWIFFLVVERNEEIDGDGDPVLGCLDWQRCSQIGRRSGIGQLRLNVTNQSELIS